MGQYTSYYLYQKYEKRGNQDWLPVYPNVFSIDGEGTKQISAKTEDDPACGYVPPVLEQYRWVNLPIGTDYICDVCDGPIYAWNKAPVSDYECNISNYTKHYKEYYQVSYDDGATWQNVEPEISRMSPDVIEYDSVDCGFSPKLIATYSNGKTMIVPCGDMLLTSGETRQYGDGYGYRTMTSAEIKDCAVGLGDGAFSGCTALTSVTLPNGFLGFQDYAFAECHSLSSITIPDSVTAFGQYTFQGCRNLTSMVIPSGVTSIGMYTFYQCSSLSSVTIPSGVTTIGNNAFEYCSNLTGITLPDAVTDIWHDAFYGCESLTSVNIPSGVTKISQNTFGNCRSLKSITLPEGITSISGSAFSYCESLTSITIPSSVTAIGNHAFQGCTGLTSVTCLATTPPRWEYYVFDYPVNCPLFVPCDSVYAYKHAFGWSSYFGDNIYPISPCEGYMYRTLTTATTCVDFDKYTVAEYQISTDGGSTWTTLTTNLSTLIEPNSSDCGYLPGAKFKATYLDGKSYSAHCNSFSMTLSSGDTRPSGYSFVAMTSAEIGDCVTSIGNRAFTSGTSLTSVTIGSSVTSIGNAAFYGCSSLTSIEIPNSVTSIGTSAFINCSGLTACTIGSGVTSIGSGAFEYCSGLTSIDIPSGVTTIGSLLFYYCYSLSSVTIPDGVTTIGWQAFNSCRSLTGITIPNSVTSIGEGAFAGCYSITSIDIPDSVTSIGNWPFSNCSGLTACTIGSGVTSLGEYVFNNCSGLTGITIEAITPPTLGNEAFYKTNNCPIYVPSGSVNIYKSADGWSTYASRIQAIP